ncbi:hypothetical protein Ahy_B10g103867 [Arachis hypogaea]|uniref:Uncharacterized protein n=1 Tax=Arachis hypogaea TaxID=3818 RepID=A0A444X4A1_ARAHY|nr:hypothetical protein Ahy_B10g103867 [Arachis hypogaea]
MPFSTPRFTFTPHSLLPSLLILFTFVVAHSSSLHLPSPVTPVESALTVAAQPCRICAHRCLSLSLSLRSPLPRTHHRHLYAPHRHLCAHHRQEEESYEALRVFEILADREKHDVRATTYAKVSVYPREVQPESPNSYRARKREYFRMRHERRKAREVGPAANLRERFEQHRHVDLLNGIYASKKSKVRFKINDICASKLHLQLNSTIAIAYSLLYLVKLSWPKTLAMKWFNIKCKTDNFQADDDDVLYQGSQRCASPPLIGRDLVNQNNGETSN